MEDGHGHGNKGKRGKIRKGARGYDRKGKEEKGWRKWRSVKTW